MRNHLFPPVSLSSCLVAIPAQLWCCSGMIRPLLLLPLGRFSCLVHKTLHSRQSALHYSHSCEHSCNPVAEKKKCYGQKFLACLEDSLKTTFGGHKRLWTQLSISHLFLPSFSAAYSSIPRIHLYMQQNSVTCWWGSLASGNPSKDCFH